VQHFSQKKRWEMSIFTKYCLTLASPKVLPLEKAERKMAFLLAFCSLIRTFAAKLL